MDVWKITQIGLKNEMRSIILSKKKIENFLGFFYSGGKTLISSILTLTCTTETEVLVSNDKTPFMK